MGSDDELIIALTGEPGDPLEGRPSNRAALQDFSAALALAGINPTQRMHFRDSTGGGATQLGQYLVPIASVAIPTFGHVIAAWIKARSGRKVRVKIGSLSVEAGTVGEVEQLVPQLMDAQSKLSKRKKQ